MGRGKTKGILNPNPVSPLDPVAGVVVVTKSVKLSKDNGGVSIGHIPKEMPGENKTLLWTDLDTGREVSISISRSHWTKGQAAKRLLYVDGGPSADSIRFPGSLGALTEHGWGEKQGSSVEQMLDMWEAFHNDEHNASLLTGGLGWDGLPIANKMVMQPGHFYLFAVAYGDLTDDKRLNNAIVTPFTPKQNRAHLPDAIPCKGRRLHGPEPGSDRGRCGVVCAIPELARKAAQGQG
jgi:hypothetical protein